MFLFSNPKQTERGIVKVDNLIFDYLGRIDKEITQTKAIYICVSSLKNNNLKILNRGSLNEMYETIAKKIEAEVFYLNNEDLVVVYNARFDEDIMATLLRLKFMFNNDPLLSESKDLEKVGLVKVYDFARGVDEFKRAIRASMREPDLKLEEASRGDADNQVIMPNRMVRRELTPSILAKLQKALSMADFSSLVRRQSICAIIGSSTPQVLFDEVYVSIADLRDMLLPDVDLTANHWLFQHLTETLDKRVLVNISQHDDGSFKGSFSLNLNVATILSDEFLAFDENLSPSMKSSIVLELQLVDIFSDVKAFILARTFAQYRGYKLCIDAITPDKLKYLNKEHFKVDFIKVIWNNSFIDVIRDDGVFNNMSADEKERIIICRVDNQEPIEVGNAMGIHLYQGRYVQRVLANRPKRTIYNIKR